MKLVYSDRSFKQISLKKPLNALLVSDLHLSDDGRSYFSTQANENPIDFFPILIKELKPDQIFVLGDLFHWRQQNNQYVTHIMALFSALEQEIFIIGGNHDGAFIESQISVWSTYTLHICSDLFLIYETDYDQIWFTHDGMNPYWLDKSQVPDFITSLKQVYRLDHHYWLITGHTHLPCLLEEAKVASLGCFNVEGHNQPLSYGIAKDITNQISFQLQNEEELYSRYIIELG